MGGERPERKKGKLQRAFVTYAALNVGRVVQCSTHFLPKFRTSVK